MRFKIIKAAIVFQNIEVNQIAFVVSILIFLTLFVTLAQLESISQYFFLSHPLNFESWISIRIHKVE